ncbi:MAG: collagen-like protein [Lachnospiraceae bacterium]|nr:collagen-like protein [Lachnospiraceae bacterium]
MALDIITLAVAKKFTKETVEGAGAIKGVPAQIQSITPITGGNRITFVWEDNAGVTHTDSMDVMDGATGETGPQGPQGSKGDKGDTGATGSQGKSAYEVAVDEGYSGAESDWLETLKGEQGDPGEGVPEGGTTGQILVKKSGTDFDTEWTDPAAGTVVDSALSGTSENPVQNKVIKSALDDKANDADLAAVAKSGDYDDLSNQPTLGTAAAKDSTNTVANGSTDLVESGAVYTGLAGKIDSTEKGAASGVAELDSTGKVPSAQLPSYVDDVVEYANQTAFPATGETGKIYVAMDTNKTYRWSGTAYVEISESLALGETSSTAYAGNKGKANEEAIDAIKDGATIDSFADVESALADKISKSATEGLVKNDGTIDTNTYLTQHQDITGKADKVSGATSGDFAALDANGNLTDSGKSASDFATPENVEDSASAQEILLRNTVGWTGKNLLKHPFHHVTHTEIQVGGTVTNAGVTYTLNSDQSFTVDGTATSGSYVIFNRKQDWEDCSLYGKRVRFCVKPVTSGVFIQLYDTDNSKTLFRTDADTGEVEFVFPASLASNNSWNISLNIPSGQTTSNNTFYSMITLAEVTDDTYEPYHESVETMYEEEVHGVNLLKNTAASTTSSGITWTVNSDGSVKANGTNESTSQVGITIFEKLLEPGAYILSGLKTDGSYSTYWINSYNVDDSVNTGDVKTAGGETVISLSTAKRIRIKIYVAGSASVSNVMFYPMLRKADIDDSTYRPYNEQAIQNQLNNQTGVLGAKNLINWTPKTETINGVTFTVNSDGTITASGTPTDIIRYHLMTDVDNVMKAIPSELIGETVIASAGFTENNGTLELSNITHNSSKSSIADHMISNGETEAKFTIESNAVYLNSYIIIDRNGAHTAVNATFKPMLRLASDPDDTYQPHAMTNRELTDGLVYKGQIPTAADLDNYKVSGIYSIVSSAVNMPSDLTNVWAPLIVVNGYNSGIRQVLLGAGYMYIRAYGGEPNAWHEWYKYTGTVIS